MLYYTELLQILVFDTTTISTNSLSSCPCALFSTDPKEKKIFSCLSQNIPDSLSTHGHVLKLTLMELHETHH